MAVAAEIKRNCSSKIRKNATTITWTKSFDLFSAILPKIFWNFQFFLFGQGFFLEDNKLSFQVSIFEFLAQNVECLNLQLCSPGSFVVKGKEKRCIMMGK